MNDRADEGLSRSGGAFERTCERCGGGSKLVATLPRIIPAYRVYHCAGCSHVEWLEQPPGK